MIFSKQRWQQVILTAAPNTTAAAPSLQIKALGGWLLGAVHAFGEAEWIENFRMTHDISAPRVALSHKCEHIGRAAFTPGWLRPSQVWWQRCLIHFLKRRCQAPTTCWHRSFSSTLKQGTAWSHYPIKSHPIQLLWEAWASSLTDSFFPAQQWKTLRMSQASFNMFVHFHSDLNRQPSKRIKAGINYIGKTECTLVSGHSHIFSIRGNV